MEYHLKAQVMGKESYLTVQHGSQRLWCMDMEGSSSTQETKGGDHTNESKTVVAMKMGDKYPTEFREMQMTLTHLRLGALRTVEHQQPFSHLHQLRGTIVTKGGKRTSTP